MNDGNGNSARKAPSFDCSDTLLYFYWNSPSLLLILFSDFTERFLWFYWIVEPSTLTRRALVIATPSARWDDNERSATSWIQRSASVNPQIRFWKSPNSLQRNHTCASVNSLKSFGQSAKVLHQKHSLSWMCRFYVTICNTCLCFAKKTDTFAYCFALF